MIVCLFKLSFHFHVITSCSLTQNHADILCSWCLSTRSIQRFHSTCHSNRFKPNKKQNRFVNNKILEHSFHTLKQFTSIQHCELETRRENKICIKIYSFPPTKFRVI